MTDHERERRRKRRAQFKPDDFDRDRTDATVLIRGAVIFVLLALYCLIRYRG